MAKSTKPASTKVRSARSKSAAAPEKAAEVTADEVQPAVVSEVVVKDAEVTAPVESGAKAKTTAKRASRSKKTPAADTASVVAAEETAEVQAPKKSRARKTAVPINPDSISAGGVPEAEPVTTAETDDKKVAKAASKDAAEATQQTKARLPKATGVAAFRESAQVATKQTFTPRQVQALLSLAAKHFGVLDIRPGQVWQNNDVRRGVRKIQVLDIEQGRVKVRNIDSDTVGSIAASAFNLGARGYTLIEG